MTPKFVQESHPKFLSSLFDDLTTTLTSGPDNYRLERSSTGIKPMWAQGPSPTFDDFDDFDEVMTSSHIEDWIKRFREMGMGTDVFEKAKEVYKNLPKFPACDIAVDRNNGDLEVKVALPGYREDDIDVSFENDNLSIVVDKDNALSREKEEHEGEKIYLRRSLTTGKIALQLPVPFTRFKVKEADADYTNGMLTIRIPRNEEHAPHRLKLGERKDDE